MRVKRACVNPERWFEYDDLPDDELATWAQASKVRGTGRWTSILLGAGVCSAVIESCGSASLYDRAVEIGALGADDQALFSGLRTESFGIALQSLRTTATTESALGRDATMALERYESVLHTLIETVRSIHVPWQEIGDQGLVQVKQLLMRYRWIFNTNYDLLLYWALRSDLDGTDDVDDTRDFFWTKSSPLVFNPSDTEVWQRNEALPKVLYLHGGLHLCQLPGGSTMKRNAKADAAEDGSLLDRLGAPIRGYGEAVPLICDGTRADRQKTVRTSDYLSFGAYQLGRSSGPLVVLGEALTERNEHLVKILRDRAGTIAVSMRREDHDNLARAKAKINANLGRAQVAFFDQQTHPLAKVPVSTG
jgi:Domain of unknown function (DUF4917)